MNHNFYSAQDAKKANVEHIYNEYKDDIDAILYKVEQTAYCGGSSVFIKVTESDNYKLMTTSYFNEDVEKLTKFFTYLGYKCSFVRYNTSKGLLLDVVISWEDEQ